MTPVRWPALCLCPSPECSAMVSHLPAFSELRENALQRYWIVLAVWVHTVYTGVAQAPLNSWQNAHICMQFRQLSY